MGRRRTGRGLTLLEMMVSLTLIGLIFTAVIAIYVTGSKAWRKGNVRGELLQELQVISNQLVKDLERTSFPSLTIDPSGEKMSFLTLYDDNGDFALDASGQPIWSGWSVYFKSGTEFRYTEVAWPVAPALRTAALPIESLAPPQSLDDYAVGGKIFSKNLTTFQAAVVPDAPAVTLQLTLEKSLDSKMKESLSSNLTVRTRN